MKPRIFIALATGILGGPGKGLVQFLKSGGLEGCYPILIDYETRPDAENLPDTEYAAAIKSTGARLVTIRQKKAFDPAIVEQCLRVIRENNLQILQSHGYKSHVLCWLLRRKTGLPWVAFVHGWTAENLKIRFYAAVELIMTMLADEVVAVSESVRSRLLPPARSRCVVIPNAVEQTETANGQSDGRDVRRGLGLQENDILAGVIGRLSPEKGQSVFLRALAAARKKDPRLKGLLVGGGQEKERLQAEAEALGLKEHCFFTGHVQGMAPYYRAMDIQVMPSFSEGMPNAALEGMLFGLPLLATNVGGIPEVVLDGATGLLVNAGDENALASGMLKLAEDSRLRASLGNSGRERVMAYFDPKVRAKRILTLYHNLLQIKS